MLKISDYISEKLILRKDKDLFDANKHDKIKATIEEFVRAYCGGIDKESINAVDFYFFLGYDATAEDVIKYLNKYGDEVVTIKFQKLKNNSSYDMLIVNKLPGKVARCVFPIISTFEEFVEDLINLRKRK